MIGASQNFLCVRKKSQNSKRKLSESLLECPSYCPRGGIHVYNIPLYGASAAATRGTVSIGRTSKRFACWPWAVSVSSFVDSADLSKPSSESR